MMLEDKYHFKVKGTGPLEFHLGTNFERDPDVTLCVSPKKYISECLVSSYETMFGEKPSTSAQSPLEHGDHPELDDSELLDPERVQKYQSLIGSLQWCISLGRFDIGCAVMSMSSFRSAPCVGHLNHLKRICGYLVKMKDLKICFRTHEPDYSDVPEYTQDWQSVHGDVKELLPLIQNHWEK